MTFWPQLLKDFTPNIYKEGSLIPIDPAQIHQKWGGREVNVILIGNYHNSHTLAEQTKELISACIKAKGVEGKAILLAEGFKPRVDCDCHLLAPRKVRVIGADCRLSAVGSEGAKGVNGVRKVQSLISKVSLHNYEEIKNFHIKQKGFNTLIFNKLADYNKLIATLKRWHRQDNLINQLAKSYQQELKAEGSLEGPESEWEDIDERELFDLEFPQSNECLADLIESYVKESPLVFAPWGAAHFTHDGAFYEKLKNRGINPLILIPENKIDYKLEFARWMEALAVDKLDVPLVCRIRGRKGHTEITVPAWMKFMLSKVTK